MPTVEDYERQYNQACRSFDLALTRKKRLEAKIEVIQALAQELDVERKGLEKSLDGAKYKGNRRRNTDKRIEIAAESMKNAQGSGGVVGKVIASLEDAMPTNLDVLEAQMEKYRTWWERAKAEVAEFLGV